MNIIPTLLALQTMYYVRKHREEEEEKDKKENDDDQLWLALIITKQEK